MLRAATNLQGHALHPADGDVGKAESFLFDDETWDVRYLVADTGGWLTGRLVLIAPQAIGEPDWDGGRLNVELTRRQIQQSPPLRSDEPVSRQQEADLHHHFGWIPYWSLSAAPGMEPVAGVPPAPGSPQRRAEAQAPVSATTAGDPNLRSTREVEGYRIIADDGEIGHAEDFVIDTDTWEIRYLVVDTRNWLPGRKVIVAPNWIEWVDWAERAVRVDLTKEQIKGSPPFNDRDPIERDYEQRLHDYYERPFDR